VCAPTRTLKSPTVLVCADSCALTRTLKFPTAVLRDRPPFVMRRLLCACADTHTRSKYFGCVSRNILHLVVSNGKCFRFRSFGFDDLNIKFIS
jgi:hypothetical protein